MYHKCQRIIIAYSIYEIILEKKNEIKSQKRRKLYSPERRAKKYCAVAKSDTERKQEALPNLQGQGI